MSDLKYFVQGRSFDNNISIYLLNYEYVSSHYSMIIIKSQRNKLRPIEAVYKKTLRTLFEH